MRIARVLAGVVLVVGVVGLEFACDDSGGDGGLTGYNGGPTGSGTLGASEVDAALPPAAQAEAMYRALQKDLETACGGACHQTGTAAGSPPLWLAGPDSYNAIRAYVGIVVPSPTASIIVTKGQHEGPPLMTGANAALGTRVVAWLTEEALVLSLKTLPATPPFTVTSSASGAQNSIDISAGETDADGGAPPLAGTKLTFTATTSGPNGDILELKNITLVAPASTAVRIAHPIFETVPTTGAAVPDPVDTFSNADVSVPAGQSAIVGTGDLFLFNWVSTNQVKIEFTVLEVTTVKADAGTTGGCKSVATFTSSAEPELKKDTCPTCHGGQNTQATSSLDLTKLGTDDTAACAQALNQVNVANGAMSNIIEAPTGGIAHPYTVTDTAAFKTALLGWINNE